MQSSHHIMFLLMTSALLNVLVIGTKTEEPNPFDYSWIKRSWACTFGKHTVPYSRCMEILNRFKAKTTFSGVIAELNKYPDCEDLKKAIPKGTEKLVIKCLTAIYSTDFMQKPN